MSTRLPLWSARAEELAREFGAEAVVIVAVIPNASGEGWTSEQAAYIDKHNGVDWELVASVVSEAATELVLSPEGPDRTLS